MTTAHMPLEMSSSADGPAPVRSTPQAIWMAQTNRLIRWIRKLVVLMLGLSVLVVGIVMIVAPGPALLVIPAGLGILATEFSWAGRLLQWMKERFSAGLRKRDWETVRNGDNSPLAKEKVPAAAVSPSARPDPHLKSQPVSAGQPIDCVSGSEQGYSST